ncbi:uncharacterized protein BT62DRAFT_934680 [Guyanagaster necrorhizus]|uniref:Uncharacterized protein n=1 Tax=Guyanagaster necrorhizus TaxID=856835 RepID=A0A9P7VNI3_9AGAR|nr:uncharacterized protein BT62DRAFT_934680 [Guyanagaster necrorhizus MCA 3950]KAG7443727.1 hypothetical protein BT62DRAFT_934680 [Guyanagaster necrorhizus MCA 3950]
MQQLSGKAATPVLLAREESRSKGLLNSLFHLWNVYRTCYPARPTLVGYATVPYSSAPMRCVDAEPNALKKVTLNTIPVLWDNR